MWYPILNKDIHDQMFQWKLFHAKQPLQESSGTGSVAVYHLPVLNSTDSPEGYN